MSQREQLDYEWRYRDGRLLCNAKDNTCNGFAMRGKTKCRSHGGATPSGPAAGRYKHGRYSKFLPSRLVTKFKDAMDDPELTQYRHSIALLTARLYELLEEGESELLWSKTQEAFRELEAAIPAENQASIRASLNALHGLIKRGRADSLRWREVYDVVERAGRMKEREHKRVAQLEQMISVEQFFEFINVVLLILTKNVQDKEALRTIVREIDFHLDRVDRETGH